MVLQRHAGFWVRLGAAILDGIIIGIPISLIALVFGEYRDIIGRLGIFLYGLLVPVYYSGYTVGKKICGIQIKRLDDEPLGIGTMLMRLLIGGLVYGFTLGIAVIISAIMVAAREDKRAIHDFIAGTVVVHDERN